jgi:4,5-dihydroxyphthalate decarboxylase
MANVPLVFAGCDTWDRSHPLIDGIVHPEGIDLTYVVVEPGDLFRRMFQYAEFESAEMSTSTLMAMVSRGDDRLVGVPVFPSRSFRHGYVFIGDKSGIERPQDLAGKRVGVPEYQMTAAVWIRAFLHHDFGVKPAEVEWFEGGFDKPGYSERAGYVCRPFRRTRAFSECSWMAS